MRYRAVPSGPLVFYALIAAKVQIRNDISPLLGKPLSPSSRSVDWNQIARKERKMKTRWIVVVAVVIVLCLAGCNWRGIRLKERRM